LTERPAECLSEVSAGVSLLLQYYLVYIHLAAKNLSSQWDLFCTRHRSYLWQSVDADASLKL